MKKKILILLLTLSSLILCSCIRTVDQTSITDLEMRKDESGNFYWVEGMGTSEDVDITIPSEYDGLPVKGISNYAFRGNEDIVSVIIPSTITVIGEESFAECEALEMVSFEEGEKEEGLTLGHRAFRECRYIEDFTIPKRTTSLGAGLFQDTEMILKYGGTAKEFEKLTQYAGWNSDYNSIKCSDKAVLFEESPGLNYEVIKGKYSPLAQELVRLTYASQCYDSVVRIPYYYYGYIVDTIGNPIDGYEYMYDGFNPLEVATFGMRHEFREIIIPRSVTKIYDYAFYQCPFLTTIRFEGTVAEWNAVEKGGKWLQLCPVKSVTCIDGSVEIVTEKLEYALESDGTYTVTGIGSCTDTYLIIPETYEGKTVTGIDSRAFKGNKQIVAVIIPKSVLDIGSEAFANCTSLTAVTFRGKPLNLSPTAFAGNYGTMFNVPWSEGEVSNEGWGAIEPIIYFHRTSY